MDKPITINFENLHRQYLQPRPKESHKYNFGHVLAIGGYQGMSGAIRLSAEAAARVGAGLVTVATHPQHSHWLNLTRPELMVHGIIDAEQLKPLFSKSTVVIIGPGLAQTAWSIALWQQTLSSNHPLVIDADGLNLLAQHPRPIPSAVLTPHPAEAARLLACTTQQVLANRLQALFQLQQRYGGVIVLKGAGTLIYDGIEAPSICLAGNPGMASAGMGDCLTGIIGGLIAQGLRLVDAARLGVCLHAYTGDLIASQQGERGMLAMDLIQLLPFVINQKAMSS